MHFELRTADELSRAQSTVVRTVSSMSHIMFLEVVCSTKCFSTHLLIQTNETTYFVCEVEYWDSFQKSKFKIIFLGYISHSV